MSAAKKSLVTVRPLAADPAIASPPEPDGSGAAPPDRPRSLLRDPVYSTGISL